MVPAFMLSLLKRQTMMLPKERFKDRYPCCWLVWEPGSWKPPPATGSEGIKTQLPVHVKDLRPLGGDALCFQLHLPRGAAEGQLTLGRGAESDIVVNDMTVSRSHVRLQREKGAWTAEAIGPPTATTQLGAKPLPSGAKQPIASGTALTVGGVTLTYYEPDEFLERVSR